MTRQIPVETLLHRLGPVLFVVTCPEMFLHRQETFRKVTLAAPS